MPPLTDAQLNAILAGLRFHQMFLEKSEKPPHWEVATNEGTVEPLAIEQIDSLCEALTLDMATPHTPTAEEVACMRAGLLLLADSLNGPGLPVRIGLTWAGSGHRDACLSSEACRDLARDLENINPAVQGAW